MGCFTIYMIDEIRKQIWKKDIHQMLIANIKIVLSGVMQNKLSRIRDIPPIKNHIISNVNNIMNITQ